MDLSESTCTQEDLDQLLVFGYASKIYRDDDKARWIDDGRHLIPLLGDSSVLIDRYDGRGALVDLKACESLGSNTPILSYEEQEVEKLCDMERYRDCRDDDDGSEDNFEIEENSKSKSKKYASFEYSYDSAEKTGSKHQHSKDRDYIPPLGLYLPPDLILPKTMKSHAIIEKTAKFISTHGTQMEIILKTKQSSNPMFNFLTLNDELHPYYRYLVIALKTNAYKPDESSMQDNSPHSSDSDEDHYLHPSLIPKAADSFAKEQILGSSNSFNYKPAGASAYAALVLKIQDMDRPLRDSEETLIWKQGQESISEGEGVDSISHSNKLMPAGETQVIIEKMASYVVKNGPAFESLACTKGDPRFTFLDESNPYHWYYVSCKQHFQAENGGVVVAGGFVPYKSESSNHSNLNPSSSLPVFSEKTVSVASVPLPNHANAINRMATLPPALIDKIEQLRKKTLENRAKGTEIGHRETEALPNSHPVPSVQPQILSPTPVGPQLPINEEEEERKLKAERKKKAAIFLHKIKTQQAKSPPPALRKTELIEPVNDVEIVAEVRKTKIFPAAKTKDSETDSDVEEIKRVTPLRQEEPKIQSTDSDSSSAEENYSKHKKRAKYLPQSSGSEDGEILRASRKKKSKKKKKKKSSKKKSRNR